MVNKVLISIKLEKNNNFISDKGDVFGWGNNEYSQMPLPNDSQQISTPTYIKMLEYLGKIKTVASGGSFCVALNGKVILVYFNY